MTGLERLEKRVADLERAFAAHAGVLNHLLEKVYSKEVIEKLDRLAAYEEERRESAGDTVR